MPQQVPRLAILLFLSVAALLVAQHLLTPETFGERGHYRTAAIDSAIALPIHYAGQMACYECHDDVVEVKQESRHRGVACEVCHGPAAQHADDPDEVLPSAPRQRSLCSLCHGYNASRPTGFPQIDPVAHNPIKPCISCHDPHQPLTPHVPEECSACHGQIARTKAVSHHAELACTQCHEAPDQHRVTPRLVLASKPKTRSVCGTCHAKGSEAPRNVPRIAMESHGNGSTVCWQCHYPHHPEVDR